MKMKLEDATLIRLAHFTPQCKASWRWALMAPIMTLLPGPQKTIMGTVVNHGGSMMWEGVSCGMPKFDTCKEAHAWCVENGINLDSVEVEFA